MLGLFAFLSLFIFTTVLSSPIGELSKTSTATTPGLQPSVIYEYPKGTWVENLVIRGDGNALVTIITAPQVQLVSTTNSTAPVLVAEIPGVAGTLGIVELGYDVFYVVAGNWSTKTFRSTPGTYSIWEVDMRHGKPQDTKLRKVADLPEAGFLNGLAVVNPVCGTLLVADSYNSAVWSVNAYTGAVDVAINDTSMSILPDAITPLGINGLFVRDDYLYYTNTNRASFNRIPIDPLTGKARGPAQTIQLVNDVTTYGTDDFALDFDGNAWITADLQSELGLLPDAVGENSTAFRHPQDPNFEIVAGSPTDQRIAGLTAARFGIRKADLKRGSLYITTNGGPLNNPSANWTNGGQLIRVDTADLGVY